MHLPHLPTLATLARLMCLPHTATDCITMSDVSVSVEGHKMSTLNRPSERAAIVGLINLRGGEKEGKGSISHSSIIAHLAPAIKLATK